MSTGRSLRLPGDAIRTPRRDASLPRRSWFTRIVATDNLSAAGVARLTLGLVMFPHAAQKLFGWFGGYGLGGTYGWFTSHLGMPGWLAGVAIIIEIVSVILLILGAFTRVAALGVAVIMVGAIALVHGSVGFFMNWYGNQGGEGFEYHLLAIGLAIVCMLLGGGAGSLDRVLTMRRMLERGEGDAPMDPTVED